MAGALTEPLGIRHKACFICLGHLIHQLQPLLNCLKFEEVYEYSPGGLALPVTWWDPDVKAGLVLYRDLWTLAERFEVRVRVRGKLRVVYTSCDPQAINESMVGYVAAQAAAELAGRVIALVKEADPLRDLVCCFDDWGEI